MTPQEIQQFVGRQVAITLSPTAPAGGPRAAGRLVGTLGAADGMVVFLEPAGGKEGDRLTIHSHHIQAITLA